MPSKQETFLTVAFALLKQKKKSLRSGMRICMYRGADNCKCAVGHLIPDELYDPAMECTGPLMFSAKVYGVLEKLGHDVQLCADLQSIHDNCEVDTWENKLVEYAREKGLAFKTHRETFYKVVSALREQGEQCRKSPGGSCQYRNDKGMKCAAGHLIPDEKYRPSMDSGGYGALNCWKEKGTAAFEVGQVLIEEGHDIRLCQELQVVHDGADVCDWESWFSRVAKEFGIPFFTRQETFDIVASHLRKQGRRSLGDYKTANGCVYRAENGDMCAAGCLIPDDKYSPSLEGEVVVTHSEVGRILAGLGHDIKLSRKLQLAHDSSHNDDFEPALAKVAGHFNLRYEFNRNDAMVAFLKNSTKLRRAEDGRRPVEITVEYDHVNEGFWYDDHTRFVPSWNCVPGGEFFSVGSAKFFCRT